MFDDRILCKVLPKRVIVLTTPLTCLKALCPCPPHWPRVPTTLGRSHCRTSRKIGKIRDKGH